jgi:hypothetical protein
MPVAILPPLAEVGLGLLSLTEEDGVFRADVMPVFPLEGEPSLGVSPSANLILRGESSSLAVGEVLLLFLTRGIISLVAYLYS